MVETNYGKKRTGTSKFVFVAPHAAGDDLKTGYIAAALAKKMDGFVLINTRFKKPTNSRAHEFPGHIEDFNKLMWWTAGQKYLWKRRHPEMKKFFSDLTEFASAARTFSSDNRAVCVHIHGMNTHEYAFDLGAGLIQNGELNQKNTGINTLERHLLQAFQETLEKRTLEDLKLPVSIGRYAGISRQSAIQFHTHEAHHDHALQIEISSLLRSEAEYREYTIALLSHTLQTVFS